MLRSAELALFCKRPDEALNILLQHKRIYRAIKWGDRERDDMFSLHILSYLIILYIFTLYIIYLLNKIIYL